MEEQPSRKISSLRKSGKLEEAWGYGCPAVQASPNDVYLKKAFFWVCYDYLKKVQGVIKERAQENHGNFNPTSTELSRINFLLEWVIWLNIAPGGYEYRSLLLVFQQNLESIPKLVLLLIRFRDDLFEDADKVPYESEKGESASLMLKFSRKVAKAWMELQDVRKTIDIDQLVMMFDRVRKEGRDKQNLIWLDYDEAKCLIISQRFEQARDCVISVLRKKQTESWAWGALAATYQQEAPNVAVRLFSKGLCHVHDEKFALPLLKGLAPLLAASGNEAQASMCVSRAVKCYENNGWKIKADVEKLTAQPWFDGDYNASDLSEFLESTSQGAMDLLHGPSEQCIAIISNIHQSGKGFWAYRDRDRDYSVRLGLYKNKKQPNPGQYILLTLSADTNDVITAEPCAVVAMDDVGSEEGEIKVTDKGLALLTISLSRLT